MSKENLGNKQKIVHNICLIKYERYDPLITPHKQKIGSIRLKKQTKKKVIITKQNQTINQKFPERESYSATKQELKKLRDTIPD